jgi:hypothetical protein
MDRCDQNVNCGAFRSFTEIDAVGGNKCDFYTKCDIRKPSVEYHSWIKNDIHAGMIKYGEHWYKET